MEVLLVDDSDINIMVMEALFEKTPIVPDTALSGEKALHMVKNKKYDIIFIDHMMPEMDGITTCGEIKKIYGNDAVLYVAMTANDDMADDSFFKDAGFDIYI